MKTVLQIALLITLSVFAVGCSNGADSPEYKAANAQFEATRAKVQRDLDDQMNCTKLRGDYIRMGMSLTAQKHKLATLGYNLDCTSSR